MWPHWIVVIKSTQESREDILELMPTLMGRPSERDVKEAAFCHLRSIPHNHPFFFPCTYCDADQVIQQLQDLVYMKMTYNTGWVCLAYSTIIGYSVPSILERSTAVELMGFWSDYWRAFTHSSNTMPHLQTLWMRPKIICLFLRHTKRNSRFIIMSRLHLVNSPMCIMTASVSVPLTMDILDFLSSVFYFKQLFIGKFVPRNHFIWGWWSKRELR